MRNIWLLLKNYMMCSIGSMRSKKTRRKTAVTVAIVTILYLAIFALSLTGQIFMCQAAATVDMQATVLAMGLIISIYISVIYATQRVTGGQKANDTELLLAMPIKKSEIMIAKGISRYAFNLLIVCLLFLPSIIAYFIYTTFNFTALLGCLVMFLMIPLITVGFSYFVDFLVTVCLPNTRLGNVVKAITTLLILVGTIAVYEILVMNLSDTATIEFINLILNFNLVLMLSLIFGGIGIFIIGNALNAFLLNRETRTVKKQKIYKQKISSKPTTPLGALLKNEVNRYLNSPALIINTIIGPVLVVALTIWQLFDRGNTIKPLIDILGFDANILAILFAISFAMCAIMTYPAAVSISLEGNQFWILRSMPINPSVIFTAKSLFNLLLIEPLIIICSVVIQIVFKFSLFYCIAMFLLPLFVAVTVAYLGLFINLLLPKFDGESDAAIIKQSGSASIMLFGGFLMIMLLGALVFLMIIRNFPIVAIIIVLLVVTVMLAAASVVLTYTLGKRIFNHI